MKALLRYYSLASLVCVVIAAVLLTLGFRRIAVEGIIQLAEASNVTLAQTAMAPIRAQLAEYLDSVAGIGPDDARSRALPPELDNAISELLEHERVIRIKLFNRNGLIVFSSKAGQTGDDGSTESRLPLRHRGPGPGQAHLPGPVQPFRRRDRGRQPRAKLHPGSAPADRPGGRRVRDVRRRE